ncbi:MAG: DUF6514 family protein [Oscillospiraceae bacterium]|nr:DUF6514 family protein [Oscillospiraceae bacterium]
MRTCYEIIEGKTVVQGESKAVFGIQCRMQPTGYIIRSIPDISTDKELIRHWITLMNKHDLSPLHFKDVVDDMLVG